MTVKVILGEKGRDVVTIAPSATLQQAASLMTARRIGALVVLGADQRVVGIISERDIVTEIAERGAATLDEPVSGCMTREVITVSETLATEELMEVMTQRKVRHLPVLEHERLVGIISIGDVVKRRVTDMEQESAALQAYIRSA
ncbi:MAG TPA: CBS domain-containing protein [Xanthobacteraceae bacterium]|nr:CBS domain-containing protein [Xanthobacteraceae bacterium]